jgi:hypothetical protein
VVCNAHLFHASTSSPSVKQIATWVQDLKSST